MDQYMLLALAICLPALSAVLCYLVRNQLLRKVIVLLTTVAMFAVAGGLFSLVVHSGGKVVINLAELHLPVDLGLLMKLADFALLAYLAWQGIKLKKPLIWVLVVLQAVPLGIFELTGKVEEPHVAFLIDYLSLIMILLVSIVGPVITVFALGYMPEHEKHLHLASSRQPRFFGILLLFLSAMNALVMTNNLSWMLFFWEVTTLCSFLLISHDGSEQALNNAVRALWINLLGGVAFVLALICIYHSLGTLALHEIAGLKPAAAFSGLLPIGLGLLCFAGFTKSAQLPFQSWLLGAMVAPTPVSALLHSSTMVKAGVYLVVRIAPAFAGTILGQLVAVVGGFTFLAASALAIGQHNGKRVLAYSTIANLGLIVCCAGIGSYVALGAAILLMVFHAVSKALLFLCVGTIEHGIGSRDIEDMQGLFKIMPFTTVIAVIGMLSMLLPPFGVLLTKWLAIEAAVHQPVVLIMIILGSAFTVVFWAKWIGIILTASYHPSYNVEKLPRSMAAALVFLVCGVVLTGIDISLLFKVNVEPFLRMAVNVPAGIELFGNGGLWLMAGSGHLVGGFSPLYFFLILLLIVLMIPYLFNKSRPIQAKPPYLCGSNTDDLKGLVFNGPADTVHHVVVHNYYFAGICGEANLTPWINLVAGAIILIMFGVVL